MSIMDWVGDLTSPRAMTKRVAKLGVTTVLKLGRGSAERLDRRIPHALRPYLPKVSMEVGGIHVEIHGLHVRRVEPEEPEDTAHPVAESPQDETEADSFFDSLPRGTRSNNGEFSDELNLPTSTEDVRTLISRMRDTIDNLDDVESFGLIEDVDDDMYQLWKELERKMQRHRQSEAKHQLKDMFSI